MSETDPLRAALLGLAADWKLDEEAVRRGVIGADEASIAGCRKMLEQILAEYPEPCTHTEYGAQLRVFDPLPVFLGYEEATARADAKALNGKLLTRQVTAWEPVKDFAPSPGHVKNRTETLHVEEA